MTNTGGRDGTDVVQLYLGYPRGSGEPPKALKGFKRVRVARGRTERVTFRLGRNALAVWDATAHARTVLDGTYPIMVGASSRDIRLRGAITVRQTVGAQFVAVDAPAVTTPGHAQTVKTTFTNTGDFALRDVDLGLRVPDGWTATPVGAGATHLRGLDAHGSASVTWTVTAPASARAGADTITGTAAYRLQGRRLTRTATATMTTPFATLAAAFDNRGISANADPGAANLDGGGYSFSAEALAAVGYTPGATVTAGGHAYTWPDTTPGQLDNATGSGQLIAVGASGVEPVVPGHGDVRHPAGDGARHLHRRHDRRRRADVPRLVQQRGDRQRAAGGDDRQLEPPADRHDRPACGEPLHDRRRAGPGQDGEHGGAAEQRLGAHLRDGHRPVGAGHEDHAPAAAGAWPNAPLEPRAPRYAAGERARRSSASSSLECIAPISSRSGSAPAAMISTARSASTSPASRSSSARTSSRDERLERLAVAQRVVDGEAERLVVAAGAEARDRLDDLHVVGVVAARVGRQHAELGEAVEHVARARRSAAHLGRRDALGLARASARSRMRSSSSISARGALGVLVEHALDHPQRHEALLLQALDQPDPLDELGRVVGHVARGAHDVVALAQQALAQVVLDRARR